MIISVYWGERKDKLTIPKLMLEKFGPNDVSQLSPAPPKRRRIMRINQENQVISTRSSKTNKSLQSNLGAKVRQSAKWAHAKIKRSFCGAMWHALKVFSKLAIDHYNRLLIICSQYSPEPISSSQDQEDFISIS